MTDLSPTKPGLAPEPLPAAPLGPASYLGFASAVIAGIAGIWAGIQGKNVEAAAAAAVTLVSVFKTQDGRFAQAVAQIEAVAAQANPWIDELQELFDGTPDDDEPNDESVNPPVGATGPEGLDQGSTFKPTTPPSLSD